MTPSRGCGGGAGAAGGASPTNPPPGAPGPGEDQQAPGVKVVKERCSTSMMYRLSQFVLAHRRWVGLFWLVVTVVGVATVSTTINRLSTQFSVPGREGFETSAKI